MANFGIKLDGLDALIAKIDAARASLPRNVAAKAYQFGEEVMALSKDRVPVDTGVLMNSGYVTPPDVTDDKITVTVGYGGPAAPYALEVHENLDPRVHWTRPGSGPKYLEGPANEMEGQFPDRIAEGVKDSFGS